jgi:hypothetical protein
MRKAINDQQSAKARQIEGRGRKTGNNKRTRKIHLRLVAQAFQPVPSVVNLARQE